MALDDRLREQSSPVNSPEDAVLKRQPGRSVTFMIAALTLTLVSVLGATGLARWLRQPVDPNRVVTAFPARLFEKWEKPDLLLIFSGQMDGYLLPCGCSHPQIGGLERRYNLLQLIKKAGWPYAALDLGDLMQQHGVAHLANHQAMLKYVYSVRALRQMGYLGISFGESEVKQNLLNVLAETSLQDPVPAVLAGNLIGWEKNFQGMLRPWVTSTPTGSSIKLGVTAVTSPTIASKIKQISGNDATLRFERTPDALDRILKELEPEKIDLAVLLYQGPLSRTGGKPPYTEAMACAQQYPQFPLVVCLSDADEPCSQPTEIAHKDGRRSYIISPGKRGKYLAVVGVYKTGNAQQPFSFKYERVELSEDFLTPADQEKNHPIVELMEEYTRQLKNDNYLQRHAPIRHELQVLPPVPDLEHQVEVKYVGSQRCKSCHKEAYDIWKKSGHSHAHQTLVDATRPSNRQYDPECIVCHTVGFGYQTGFVNESLTEHLKDVGCESCHGPCSTHVRNPENKEWHKRINPWKYMPANKRELAMDLFCQKCHDADNDVNWTNGGFKRKWPKIAHPSPKQEP